jgi:hypothetical protein
MFVQRRSETHTITNQQYKRDNQGRLILWKDGWKETLTSPSHSQILNWQKQGEEKYNEPKESSSEGRRW